MYVYIHSELCRIGLPSSVIPAKAGIQNDEPERLDFHLRGNDRTADSNTQPILQHRMTSNTLFHRSAPSSRVPKSNSFGIKNQLAVDAQNASGELCAPTQERHDFAPPTRRLEPRRPASKPHHSPRDPQNSLGQPTAASSRPKTLTPYHSPLKPYAAPQPPRPNPRNRLFSRPQVPIIERFTADSPPRTSAPRKCLSKTRHSPLPIPHLY